MEKICECASGREKLRKKKNPCTVKSKQDWVTRGAKKEKKSIFYIITFGESYFIGRNFVTWTGKAQRTVSRECMCWDIISWKIKRETRRTHSTRYTIILHWQCAQSSFPFRVFLHFFLVSRQFSLFLSHSSCLIVLVWIHIWIKKLFCEWKSTCRR